jgi:hypothetical protein
MRRGRPRLNPEPVAQDAASPDALSPPVKPARRRPRGNVSGMHLKLDAPQRLGYVRRWFHDDGNRLAQAQDLAYDFVHDTGIKSDAEGTRIARRVGTKANGEPLYDYLMETPVEEYRAGLEDKEAPLKAIDDAIREGQPGVGQVEKSYGSGSIDTTVR